MKFWIGFFICITGIAGLFFLDRDKTTRNAKALWLPVIWLWLVGSRPVSAWLGGGATSGRGLSSTLDGNPMDAAIYAALVLLGVAVLFFRGSNATKLIQANTIITLFFFYCLLS